MYKEHDVVVLRRELPEHGLLRGDVGAIVGMYEAGGYEVEFAAAEGDTVAVVTLAADDLRPIGRREMFTVREVTKLAG
jgi:hypothetical protein